MEGVLFEGINSVQNFDLMTSGLEQSDCAWTSEDDSFPTCPELFLGEPENSILIDRSQVCQLRSYDSFLQMRTIHSSINSTDQIQSVNITNCTF